MERSYRGAVSFMLIMLFTVVGIIAAFMRSPVWGIAYAVTAAVAIALVVVVYCAKCPGKRRCVHIVPGLIARHISRAPKPYTIPELLITAGAFLALALVPQPVLVSHKGLLVLFWALTVAAALEIYLVMCRRCFNAFCPLNRRS